MREQITECVSILLKCEKMTELASRSLDEKLPLYQRLSVGFHLKICRMCSNNVKQFKLLRTIFRLAAEKEKSFTNQKLSPDQKLKIKKEIAKKI